MADKNGNKWLTNNLLKLLFIGAAAVAAYGMFQGETKRDVAHLHEAMQDTQDDQLLQWIDIDSNTKHQHIFEEKVNNIERDVGLILKEVRK